MCLNLCYSAPGVHTSRVCELRDKSEPSRYHGDEHQLTAGTWSCAKYKSMLPFPQYLFIVSDHALQLSIQLVPRPINHLPQGAGEAPHFVGSISSAQNSSGAGSRSLSMFHVVGTLRSVMLTTPIVLSTASSFPLQASQLVVNSPRGEGLGSIPQELIQQQNTPSLDNVRFYTCCLLSSAYQCDNQACHCEKHPAPADNMPVGASEIENQRTTNHGSTRPRRRRLRKSRATAQVVDTDRVQLIENAYYHVRAHVISTYGFPVDNLTVQVSGKIEELPETAKAGDVVRDTVMVAHQELVEDGIKVPNIDAGLTRAEVELVRIFIDHFAAISLSITPSIHT